MRGTSQIRKNFRPQVKTPSERAQKFSKNIKRFEYHMINNSSNFCFNGTGTTKDEQKFVQNYYIFLFLDVHTVTSFY